MWKNEILPIVTPYTEIMTRIIAVFKFESKAPTLLKNGIFS